MPLHSRRFRHRLSSPFGVVEIGRRVRRLRQAAKLTQAEAAEAMGLARSYLTEIELGTCRGGIEAMTAIADYFKVPFDWVMARKPPPDGPLVGQFIDDPDELAWLRFWRVLDDVERAGVLKLLRIARTDIVA